MKYEDLVTGIAEAIAHMEGYFKAGSVAARNNNPGNLRSWGTTPQVGGFAQFASADLGWRALRTQVRKNIDRNLSLLEFFNGQRTPNGTIKVGGYGGYAPASDGNDPTAYARFVGGKVGVDVQRPLREVVDG